MKKTTRTTGIRRHGVVAVCLVALVQGALPALAAPLPSRAESHDDRRIVENFLARDDVARALADRGLSRDEVDERLSKLSDEDIRYLAGHVDQIQSAGRVPDYIWILLGVLLGVLILSAIF